MGASLTPMPMSTVPVTAPTPGTLNCFLVEDSPLIRENLVATLQEMLDLDVVAWAEDEAGALRWLHDEAVPCDILIIDLFLKRGSGISLRPKARLLQPEAKVIVLFMHKGKSQELAPLMADYPLAAPKPEPVLEGAAQ